MKGVHILLVLSFLALASSFASASDPSPLQDFCIGVDGSSNGVFVNGKFCKDPRLATAEDFFFSGFNIRKNTSNPLGTTVTLAYDAVLPGVNTLGVSVFRVDYAPNGGLYPPHIHPRSSEILTVLEGRLYAGFVASAPENRLIGKVLNPGDGFVFPQGLVHFHYNIGRTNAVAFAAFGSQNPGIVFVANTVFGSKPPINPDVLAKAFQLDRNTVRDLQSKFGPSN